MSPVHVLGAAGARHTMPTTGATRVCDRDGCDSEFVPVRRAHVYCSRICRAAAWKARRGYEDPRRARRAVEASRNASAAVRRPRPVRVRPTLTLDEARALVLDGDGTIVGVDPRGAALDKIRAALEREEARHG